MSAPNFPQAERYMLTDAGRCVGGEIGQSLALQVAAVMRHRYNLNEADWLRFAKPWNAAGGEPFTLDQLRDIYNNAPPPTRYKRKPRLDPGPVLPFEESA